MPESRQGLLLLDKPSGVTSFGCVAAVRRKLDVKRVGHCGTLDPSARGLLLILVGPATREQESFLGLEKQYWFRGEFGRKSATGDLEGEIIDQKPFADITQRQVELILQQFVGTIEQVPPMYSALKFKGRPYYDYARKGVAIPRFPRPVTLYSFELLSFDLPYWTARVVCSRGTYIRTLAEDVADRLGTCGTLVELVRERIGTYTQAQALSWQKLHTMDQATLLSILRPVIHGAVLTHA